MSCWDVRGENPQPIWTQPAHQGWIRALAVSPDGRCVASAGNDKLIRVWTAAWGMDLSAGGNLIVTAHHDRQLRLYELPPMTAGG